MNWDALPRHRADNGIAYIRRGQGAPLLLLHGVGLRAESWLAQVQAFAARHTVYALDMAGHGESDRLPGTPALADYSERVAEVIDAELDGPAWVAGHSMGGLIALDLAARHPARCRGVAALNAIFRRAPDVARAVRERSAALGRDTPESVVTAPVTRWFGQPPSDADAAAAAACRDWLLHGDRDGYAAAYRVFAHEDGPSDEALGGLRMPVLCLTGSEDGNSTVHMSRSMAQRVPAGELAVIHGAGHMAPMTHATHVNAALRRWLSRARCSDSSTR
jgi:pimeloyl-ACP methyl ester carboxylesterase